MEKQPQPNFYQRAKSQLGRVIMGGLERIDPANTPFDNYDGYLLEDTQELDLSELRVEEHLVRGEE
jgi:hypothetical protein